MHKNLEVQRWIAEAGARAVEFDLAMTGNPRAGTFVDHDTLAVLVLMARRSSAYQDYPFEYAEGLRARVEKAMGLVDERSYEYIENAMADYHAHVQAYVEEERAGAVPTPQHG